MLSVLKQKRTRANVLNLTFWLLYSCIISRRNECLKKKKRKKKRLVLKEPDYC